MSAEMRHWTDGAAVSDLGILNQTVIADLDAVTDTRIRDPSPRVDRASVTDLRPALDRHIRMNDRVATDLRGFTDINIFGIDEADAVIEHQTHHGSPIQKLFQIGQLRAIFDAFDL